MIVGIDARMALHKRRGIGNYVLNIINRIDKDNTNRRYIIYLDKHDSECLIHKHDNVILKTVKPSNYAIWEQVILPSEALRDKVDILHCMANTGPICINKRIKLVLTVHDLIYMSNSDVYNNGMSYYQKMGRIYRRIVVPKSVRNAAKIIAVSAYTKRDIVRYFPWYRDGDVVVVHSGVGSIDGVGDCGDDMLKTQNTYGIKGNYIIALGGQDPRKNTRMIIEAFRFIKQNANISCKLVIVGMSSWKKGVYNQMAKEVFCGNDIIFTGFVGDRDLINLYKNALLFIYPSLYEGFGHPPLEAMACGVPVIASNVSSIPEIVGNAAYLVNPYNINEIIGAILQLLHDGDMRAELIRRGYEKVSEYSWDRTVRNTVGVYESIEIVK